MKRDYELKVWLTTIALILINAICLYGENIQLKLTKEVELGKEGEPFYLIYSICEDDEGNIYILDKKSSKVRKFSESGKELMSFGRKGEGPGDFKAPKKMYYSKDLGVIVAEAMNEASIFTKQGKLIKKINFAAKVGLLFNVRYIGGHIFYGEQRKKDGKRHQVLMNIEGKVLDTELYASKGWVVRTNDGFSYRLVFEELTPMLVLESYNGNAVAAVSDNYELKLLDGRGKVATLLRREIRDVPLTRKEKRYFIQSINDTQGWAPSVKKEFEKLIPKNKMYFYKAMPTTKYVFVFRTKKDTTNEKQPYPVDIFEINGKFLGDAVLSAIPILVSDKYIYLEKTDEEDEVILVKYKYELVTRS